MSYRESHQHKGADYHETFASCPHRALLWSLEQRILDRVLRRHVPRPGRYLDFACGTGRILEAVSPRMAASVGVDISASMLAETRRRLPGVELIEGDLTREDLLDGRTFDLITAFRFFPNAEPALRDEVMGALVRQLGRDGVIVFNNHRNTASVGRLTVLLRGRNPGLGMSAWEVDQLLARHGLVVRARYAAGLLPLSDRRMPRATGALRRVEGLLARIPGAWRYAQDIVYVVGRR